MVTSVEKFVVTVSFSNAEDIKKDKKINTK